MPMMEVRASQAVVTAATASGVLTVADNQLFSPGGMAWVRATSGGESARVLILNRLGTTDLKVRRFKDDNENTAPPSYGGSDMSGFGASTIFQESQLVPYDPAYVKHSVA